MALSSVSYLGDGSNSLFSVSFVYLSKAHVKVFVDGVEDTTFTWATSASITTSTIPANGVIVLIKRETPTSPIVDFVDGSTLTESLLDTSTIQSLYVAEESQDNLTNSLRKDTLDNTWNGESLVIKNVANPVSPQDVATKAWSESAVTSSVAQAASSAANAATSATNSANSATTSATQAGIAATQAGIATTQAGIAATQAGNAATSASTASTQATNASNSASSASASASSATTQASNASTSATNAATSASNAATSEINAENSAIAAAASAGSLSLASQAEAEAGVENTKYLSSLRVKQAITANVPTAFPSGTRLAFNQTSAPTGWTKDTTAALNDSILRIVTGTVGSGGANAFSTVNNQTGVGATTLSTAQMPSHSHQTGMSVTDDNAGSGSQWRQGTGGITSNLSTVAQGGGGSHTHSMKMGIKYNDFIIASKD